MTRYLTFFLFIFILKVTATPFPIQFSISEKKIVNEIPKKLQDFATVIPGKINTYVFHSEKEYYHDYQKSYFGVTCCKGGWDCMRHYEILANGCIPYFLDLDKCDLNTMHFLPRDLIKEAMNMEGVSYLKIDHSRFDLAKYYDLLNKILEHTRNHLSSKSMAKYILQKINYSGSGKILYLSNSTEPDYLRCCTLIGFKELLGDRIVDYPKIEHIYRNYRRDTKRLYGKGFTYTRVIDEIPVDRNNIEERIKQKEFDLIIYGSFHRGLIWHDLVQQVYTPDEVVYLCGEDFHNCDFHGHKNFFLREFSGNK
jgi:hypothetical protein